MLLLNYDPTRQQIDESEKAKRNAFKDFLVKEREQKIRYLIGEQRRLFMVSTEIMEIDDKLKLIDDQIRKNQVVTTRDL